MKWAPFAFISGFGQTLHRFLNDSADGRIGGPPCQLADGNVLTEAKYWVSGPRGAVINITDRDTYLHNVSEFTFHI